MSFNNASFNIYKYTTAYPYTLFHAFTNATGTTANVSVAGVYASNGNVSLPLNSTTSVTVAPATSPALTCTSYSSYTYQVTQGSVIDIVRMLT